MDAAVVQEMDSRSFFDRWMVERLRSVRRQHGETSSPVPGYAGLMEDVRTATANMTPDELLAFEMKVLTDLMGGRTMVALFGLLARRWPEGFAKVWTRLTPLGFRWLVGRIEPSGPRAVDVPQCAFLAVGGEAACLETCKRCTGEFFRSQMALPIRLTPDLKRGSCRIEYGV